MDIKYKPTSEKICIWFAWMVIGFGVGIAFLYVGLILSNYTPPLMKQLNYERAGSIGSFLAGTVGVLWSLGAVLLYYSALMVQKNSYEMQVKFFSREQIEYDVKRHDDRMDSAIRIMLDFFERSMGIEGSSNAYVIKWSLDVYNNNKSSETFLNNTDGYRAIMAYLFKTVSESPQEKDKEEYSRLILALLTNEQLNCLALISTFDEGVKESLISAKCKFSRGVLSEDIATNMSNALLTSS